jgi:hypothetical protein
MLTVPPDELRRHLAEAGHALLDLGDMPGVVAVRMGPESIVTVAAGFDAVVRPAYRQRYFVCVYESKESSTPRVTDDPRFALPTDFLRAAEVDPAGGDFAPGPFRWLLHRLSRFDRLLLWSGSQTGRRGPLAQHLGPVAAVLDLRVAGDCQLLWWAAKAVSEEFDDFYVADERCAEVYEMHHHDKIVACIPDASVRRLMLDELRALRGLFEDCSGYVLGSDEGTFDSEEE